MESARRRELASRLLDGYVHGPAAATEATARSLAKAEAGDRFQFERLGYFCVDPDTTSERLVFNRTVPLRDTWAKIESRDKANG